MKICIVSYYDLVRRDTGGPVRTYNLAKNLAAQGHDIVVIIPSRKEGSEFANDLVIKRVKGYLPFGFLKILGMLLSVSNVPSLYLYDLSFFVKAYSTLLKSEVVQIDTPVPLGGFITFFLSKILRKIVVLDSHDVFQALRLEYSSNIRRILELPVEKIAYRYAALILTVSQKDKMLLANYGIIPSKIIVIPNGVDITMFSHQANINDVWNSHNHSDSFKVVFVGNMEYPPNQEAVNLIATKIAPEISKKIRNVTFIMVGRKPQKLPAVSNMIFTGVVPNIVPFLLASDVAIAPLLHGSGSRLKILEYLSCCLPVVSTSVGIEGLTAQDGVHLFVEDDMSRFSARIIELLLNAKLRKRFGSSGRELVVKEYDWHEIGKTLSSSLISASAQ